MKTYARTRAGAFVMALLLFLLPAAGALAEGMVARAEGSPVLKLHYHREDGSYEGWDVWLWEVGGEGGGVAFAEENGEMVATKEISPGITSVGFIVRTQDWVKDFDGDQFIDISEVISGTVHIYIESGVEGYTK